MVDWVNVLPLIIGVLGLAGLIFTAMRYGRDDTTQVINQQAQITQEMQALHSELRITAERLRKERDACLTDLERLRG